MHDYIETINPYTETVIKKYPLLNEAAVEEAIDRGHQAFTDWRKKSVQERAKPIRQLARLLRSRSDELAALMATEMGKPLSAGKMEIEKCAWCCEFFADNAAGFLTPSPIDTNFQKTMVYYEPLGLVFSIMPWNYPFWQVYRCAIPALMAGNVVLSKHAPISTGSGAAIVALFKEAGLPEYCFQQLIIDNEQVKIVISNPKVIGLSFTGSEQTGRLLGQLAGAQLKKMVFELGGSDPYIVLEDADIDEAAKAIVSSRLNNSGQVCIAPKRIIALAAIEQALQGKIVHYMRDYQMGDPLDEKTNFGPLARRDLQENVEKQVALSIKKGAKLVKGGQLPDRKGFFYPPTLLTQVKPGMPAFDEELFGPVIALIKASSEEEAITLANKTPFGLGAGVFTKDIKRGERIAVEEIEAGSCFVNVPVSSDPRVPFGGIKNSGLGRELGREGILEFVNIKTVSIR